MIKYNVLTLTKNIGGYNSVINPVLIEDENELILFDAGYPNQSADFEKALNQLNYSVADISKVVVSHHDHDHIGSLNELKNINENIEIWTSEIEAKYISGAEKSLRVIQAEKYNETLKGKDKSLGEQFVNYLNSINTCHVDKIINDGDYITKKVRVVNTPGHTPGHISLLIEDENILLAGDALAIENDKLVIANPEFTLNMKDTLNSIRKILQMRVNKIICYHGGLFVGNIDNSLNELLSASNETIHY